MNLMDMVKGQLTDVVLQKIGGSVGLSTGETTKALDTIIPAQLGSIINMASNPSGAQNLMNLAGNFANLGSISNLLGQADGMQNLLKMGQTLLPTLFGNKLGDVVGAIASHTGIKNGPINSLMSIAGPMIMGALGSHIKSQGLNAMGLVSMLAGLKGTVSNALPANLNNLVGLGGLAGVAGAASSLAGQAARGASTIAGSVTQAAGQTTNRRGGLGWILPAALVLLLGGALLWLLNRPAAPTTTTTAPTTTTDTTGTVGAATTETTTAAAGCTGDLSLAVQNGATVVQPFRFGGTGAGQGYTVTIKRADGKVIGSKDLPLDSSCGWGFDSQPGRGQVTYELRPIGATATDAPLQTLTLNVE